MDERDWWIELDNRISIAEDNGFHEVKLTFDEVKEVIMLLQELDDMKNWDEMFLRFTTNMFFEHENEHRPD